MSRPGARRGLLPLALLVAALLVAAATLLTPAPGREADARPAGTSALERRLDAALLQARRATGAPAVSAAVVRDGRVLWARTTGYADDERGIRATARTRFITASAGKTVTAAMVLRLAEEGRLTLDDRPARFLPELPGADAVTVRMLLEHRSGYGDYTARVERLIEDEPYRRWRRDDVLRGVRPAGPPGRSRYSNVGYVILGGVIERVTGASLDSAFRRLVGDPLALGQTTWRRRPARAPAIAVGNYDEDGELVTAWPARGLVPTDAWGEVWTDGGLASTGRDLARFANALYAGSLLRPATRALVSDVGDDEEGLGTYVLDAAGAEWLGHNGNYGGYEAEHWTDPERALTVAVMTNLESGEDADRSVSERIWRRLASAAG